MEEEALKNYQPDLSIFNCTLCKAIYEKPVTLACGHTFCYYCIAQQLQNQQQDNQDNPVKHSLVPLCPQCRQIIWR